MIISVPKLINAGIGNLFFPLAKSFLASQALNCRLLIPYQIDTTRLKIYFNPIKMGYLPYLPNPLKKIVFTYEDYIKIRSETMTDDYFVNVKFFADRLDLRNKVLVNEGMWGGYSSIYRARSWIKTLLAANRSSRMAISEMGCRCSMNRIQIGFHIRRSDFKSPTTNSPTVQSLWNVQTPISWFEHIARILSEELGRKNLDFILFTDSPKDEEIASFKQDYGFVNQKQRPGNVYSDLYLMSECDLLVCSNSSYSMLAAFLSESPYLMYKEYLLKKGEKYQLWDEVIYDYRSEPGCGKPRGYICGNGDISQELLAYLDEKIKTMNSKNCELIFGGKLS